MNEIKELKRKKEREKIARREKQTIPERKK
jgi:hypothetical protein